MTAAGSVTYMVADIIGSSLIMQQDQRKAIGLFEKFQSLLLPLIENEGGSDVEYTGDAVSAAFDNCRSAVAASLAIHAALKRWNLGSSGSALQARIGIFSSVTASDAHQRQLSLAAATCLQSLGRKDALCVSVCDLEAIVREFPLTVYRRGKHDLGFLPEPAAVYYLYLERPGFLSQLTLLFDYLKTGYFSQMKSAIRVPLIAVSLLLVFDLLLFQFLNDSPYSGAGQIEVNMIDDFTEGEFEPHPGGLIERLRARINSLPAGQDGQKISSSITVTSGYQHHSGIIRLNWGVVHQASGILQAGGIITGRTEELADLESRFIGEIITEIENEYSDKMVTH